jgi:hypothetical protein
MVDKSPSVQKIDAERKWSMAKKELSVVQIRTWVTLSSTTFLQLDSICSVYRNTRNEQYDQSFKNCYCRFHISLRYLHVLNLTWKNRATMIDHVRIAYRYNLREINQCREYLFGTTRPFFSLNFDKVHFSYIWEGKET